MATKNPLHPIPNPPGRPIVGNMLTVDAEAPLQSLMALTRDQGPIFWLDMMGKPMVIVSGAELVKELCEENRFDKAVRGALRRVRAIGGDGLFTGDTQAPNWSKAHNILLPTFSQRAMVDYFPMMVDIAGQLVMKWERMNADDEIDVVHDMTAVALDTIGVCGFDYRFNSFYRQDFHPFIDALTRTLETSMMQRGLPFEDVVLRNRMDQLKKDVDYMNNLVDEIIRERRRGGGDNAQKDLLNYMLAGVDKVTGESLSDENIRDQINTFLIAGHETTSGLLSFTLYFLLNNPDVLAKAYEEVDRVLGRDIAAPPTYAQVNQLDYVRAILLESLRLWPTAPAFSVYPYEDEVIGGEYQIKKNTFITILTLMLHRDPSVWGDDAETFNPDNFSREAEAARPAYAYKPFGNGQRACIGRQFAMQEATLILGMILQRFNLFDHTNYTLKVKETMSIKPDGFKMKVRLREDAVRGALVSAGADAEATPEKKAAQKPKHGTPLCVLYGSNLGATEAYARDIAQAGELNGFETTLAPLDDFAGRLPTDGAVIIASASYNGAPPDNAINFLEWLDNASPDAADGVAYAVFGCGNRDWASTFQAVPREIDEKLAGLGARRIADRGEGDAREDLDGQFHAWFDTLWPSISDALKLDIDLTDAEEAEPLYEVEIAESVTANPVANQTGAAPMTILENCELQTHADDAADARSTRHIELALPEGMSYKPGDHLCVVPVNHPDLVARVLARFGFDEESHIRVHVTGGRRSPFPNDSTFSVKRLADVYGELQAVATRKDVGVLARYTRCPDTKKKLEALAAPASDDGDLYREEVFLKRRSVFDLLEEFSACELPFAVFLEIIPWNAPRYYSISSSPKVTPDRLSVTVSVVKGPARSGRGIYRGMCSNYLAEARKGDVILASVKEPTAEFRIPDDPSRPIIMVGPGTGLAPFRAFIQERRALKDAGETLGRAMLFFGCRHPEQDYLYEEELKAAEADGLIELHAAFSRYNGERVYVQDLIRKHGGQVWSLIEDGAVIFVCGDGAGMEPDVKRTLASLYATEKDVAFEDGELWIDNLAKEGRYVLDVWAGG
ncbi:MAG: bifunctional cytochrome P450/NADPH--P450 reductase [Pseudomonadota bacterium]